MSILTYTLGNNNNLTFGSASKVTAGLSNSVTIGATNSVSVGTTTSLFAGGTVSASVSGNVSWNYSGALSMSGGKTISLTESSTTQAKDSVQLTGGCDPAATLAWGAAEAALTNVKLALGGLLATNVAIGATSAGLAAPTGGAAATTPQDFDNNKMMLDSALATSTIAFGANVGFGVLIGVLMKRVADALDKVKQISTLKLDANGCNLSSSFSDLPLPAINKASLSMPTGYASLGRTKGSALSAGLSAVYLQDSSTALTFQSGVASPGMLTASSSATVKVDKNSVTLGTTGIPAVIQDGSAPTLDTSGPSFVISNGAQASIVGSLGTSSPTDSFKLSEASFLVSVGAAPAKSSLSLAATGTGLSYQGPAGTQGLVADDRGVYITGPATTQFSASETGIAIAGPLIKLG
ncbi:hypothetical protein [Caballeronia sp. GAWG2-1]|uniref:hypothetical protein n=1 Tax=Caballeronia sp. GAWG2-1 TaxID=2921744 RepID=UPI0020284452|nr:hypothetical protein [Caballeronia sp. GAWG2-1]